MKVINKKHHYKTARVRVDLFTQLSTPILHKGDFVCLTDYDEKLAEFEVCHKGTVVTVCEEHLENFVL